MDERKKSIEVFSNNETTLTWNCCESSIEQNTNTAEQLKAYISHPTNPTHYPYPVKTCRNTFFEVSKN